MQARQPFGSALGYGFRLMALALALAWPARARADQTFILEASDPGSGTDSIAVLQATPNGDGSFTATSGCLFVFSGPNVGTYDLVPNPDPPNIFVSPSGAFLVDDQLFPGQDPLLNMFGLLFEGNGLEINIWGNGPGIPYSYFSFNGSFYNLFSNNADVSQISTSDPFALIFLDQYLISFLVSTGALSQNVAVNLNARLELALGVANLGHNLQAIGNLRSFIGAANVLAPTGIGQCLGNVAALAIEALGG
jgi:hypothetical protein